MSDERRAEIRACVIGTLTEIGFLPHSRKQEARGGGGFPDTHPLPSSVSRTKIAATGSPLPGINPTEAAGAANRLTDTAENWMDGLAAWDRAGKDDK